MEEEVDQSHSVPALISGVDVLEEELIEGCGWVQLMGAFQVPHSLSPYEKILRTKIQLLVFGNLKGLQGPYLCLDAYS